MKMHTATRTRITVDMTTDFDPTGTTLELKVGATWHPCTWQGSPVAAGGQWKQTAQTTGYFAGPGHTAPDGAVILALGRHFAETRVTTGTGDITARSEPVDVVA